MNAVFPRLPCFKRAPHASLGRRLSFAIIVAGYALAVAFLPTPMSAAEAAAGSRVPWTTSRLTGSPNPPRPFVTERVFPGLTFTNPVEFASLPGSDRLCVLELRGRVYSFRNRPDAGTAEPDLVADLAGAIPGVRQAFGLVFDPGFATNRFVYLSYVLAAKLPEGTRLSRFRLDSLEPPRIDLASERILLTWLSGGHNGGSLHFGADGCLYVSTGDAEVPNPPDPLDTGQDLGDLLGSILRIDVRASTDARPYRVPPDNPFVNTPGARPEIWAYGFRNPWKMSFDRRTGDLWVGDVGWEMWEMIYRVERGGNYGWSIVEGPQPVKPNGRRGPTPILPPVVAHSHIESRSITGGYVYRGRRLPELAGAYVYGDYVTGKLWSLRHDGARVTSRQEIAGAPFQIICFGEDHAGELFVVGYDGTLNRLVPNPAPAPVLPFPRRLSETGLFADVRASRPAPGVLPYSLKHEPWADHSLAERFVAIPGLEKLAVYPRNDFQIGEVKGAWKYPKDSVLAKTVSLELKRGDPSGRRRLETQVLHYNGDTWQAYNYLWNDAQSDAVLAEPGATDIALQVRDPQATGGERRQNWHFAARSECLLCHTARAGSVLGFHPVLLDHPRTPGQRETQLENFQRLGLFLAPPVVPKFKDDSATDDSAFNARVRHYLHWNCAHCHSPGGGGTTTVDLRLETPLAKTGLLDARPTQGDFGLRDARVVAPGDPLSSALLYRMAKLGRGRMPHFGSAEVDVEGVRLIAEWIRRLPTSANSATSKRAEPDPLLQQFLAREGKDEQRVVAARQLLATSSGALALALEFDAAQAALPRALRTAVTSAAAEGPPAVRDLFERFLPDHLRSPKLGTDIRPADILVLAGDAPRGRRLFFQADGVQCAGCHRVNGEGREIGPDLSDVGRRLEAAQILESLVEPSKLIDPKFAAVTIETRSGDYHTGYVTARTAVELAMRDTTGRDVRLKLSDIASQQAQRLSLMPEGLLQNLTAQEAADLVAFLRSLR